MNSPRRAEKPMSTLKSAILVVIGLSWVLMIVVGLVVLWDYDTGPAPPGHPPQRWPVASHLPAPAGRARLVVAAHPHCPCTRASVGELERLMAQAGEHVEAYVLFFRPDGVPEEWVQTALWSRAAAIPGVHVVRDDGGAKSERFGALASGQAMLYGANGALLFRGGITASRGHSGDNPGRAAIVALARGERSSPVVTPVFGCTLREGIGTQPRTRGGITLVRQFLGRLGVPVRTVE